MGRVPRFAKGKRTGRDPENDLHGSTASAIDFQTSLWAALRRLGRFRLLSDPKPIRRTQKSSASCLGPYSESCRRVFPCERRGRRRETGGVLAASIDRVVGSDHMARCVAFVESQSYLWALVGGSQTKKETSTSPARTRQISQPLGGRAGARHALAN